MLKISNAFRVHVNIIERIEYIRFVWSIVSSLAQEPRVAALFVDMVNGAVESHDDGSPISCAHNQCSVCNK